MICCIFDYFCFLSGCLILTIITFHVLSLFLGKKVPVKLEKDSYVVITGACMGIGRQMALEIARLYNCTILVIDLRKDLFESITSEIEESGGKC